MCSEIFNSPSQKLKMAVYWGYDNEPRVHSSGLPVGFKPISEQFSWGRAWGLPGLLLYPPYPTSGQNIMQAQ